MNAPLGDPTVVVVDDVVVVVSVTDVVVVAGTEVLEVLVVTVVDVVTSIVVVVANVLLVELLLDVELLVDTVVLGAVLVVVVLTAHGSGVHVPGPRSMPLCAAHSVGESSSHANAPTPSNAPATDAGTQHCVAGQSAQQVVLVPTVPWRRSHFSADGAMSQRPCLVHVTASGRPHVDFREQRMTADRQLFASPRSFVAFATHAVYAPRLVAS